MEKIEKDIEKKLFEMQDLEYKAFNCKLIPNVDSTTVIGVRTLQLRKFAKEISKTDEANKFLEILPHKYYEENNLHGFILESIKDYDVLIEKLEEFLPYIDNWATCDLISPKIFKKHTNKLYEKIKEWIKSDKTYTIRFGIEMLMSFYLENKFTLESAQLVANVKSEEYYVNMMIAWYFTTALAKQEKLILPFFSEQKLDKWTHNKAIQKSVESRRISDEMKKYLKSLKIK